MDASETTSNPNPREKANCISVSIFWWTIALFKKGCNKTLGAGDLYDPLPTDRSSVLGDRLEKQWRSELQNSKEDKREPSLLKTIFRTFLFENFIQVCIQILNEFVLRLGTPMILGALLQYFKSESNTTFENALICAAGLSIAIAIGTITYNQHTYYSFHLGGKIRIALCSVVYRKALRLSKTALGETPPGKIVNLVANDVSRFEYVPILVHFLWSAPLLALIIGYFMYTRAGYAGLIGIAVVFVVVPIQSYTGKLSSKFRHQSAIKTDERVRLMNEIISGVQVIKMYAWEKPFCILVEQARRLELNVIRKSSYIRAIFMTFYLFTTRVALFATLITLMLTGEKISADKVYVYSSLFGALSQTMSARFVRAFAEMAECLVSVRRLQNFLTFEEFQADNVTTSLLTTSASSVNANSSNEACNSSIHGLSYINKGFDNANECSGDKSNAVLSEQLEKIIDADAKLANNVNSINNSDERQKSWSVKLDDVTAKWNLTSSDVTLENINLKVEEGKLYIVIGAVGAGKSSLLSTILGELNLLQGKVTVDGLISYASQDAWVFGSTFRQNILFGQEFDQQRYQRVIKSCDLLKDFEQFPEGDQTVVGERGSSLSGGQKSRINLARAVYRQADIYLLDDPLSAVDAHVGKHLFEECLQKYLEDKSRILATHQLQYVKEADSIILMDQGRMYQYSDYRELLNVHPQYSCMITEEDRGEINGDRYSEATQIERQSSSSSAKNLQPESSGAETDGKEVPTKLNDLMEKTSRGTVKGNLLLCYFQVGSGICMFILLIFLFLVTQLVTSLTDSFIPILINAEESRSYYEELRAREDLSTDLQLNANYSLKIMEEDKILPRNYYIYIYSVFVLSIFVIGMIRSFTFYIICMRCSQRIHDLVFGALIRTSMRFFDINPSGRILNRFSKDLGVIDDLLPKALLDAGQMLLMMLGSIVVSCTINPMFLIPLLFIGTILYWIRRFYLKTSKNVKRLEGITRSPVFTHLNATLNGISTIRAYRAHKILEKEFDKFQDIHTSAWYMFLTCSMAYAFSLELCSFIFTSLVTFSFLIFKESFSGEQVGLAITQVISLTVMIQWGMRQAAEVANQMMSVERVLEYVDLPSEPNLLRDKVISMKSKKLDKPEQKLTNVEPPKNWPNTGHINFQNVYMRYSDEGAPVLKGLTFNIFPSEKVGIVGRTGAGKSSLISAIFRLAKVEGVIEIDGIDTGNIALEDLRSHISIIPQDPVIFSGTLRHNLDPFNEFPDKRLWEVLEEVNLKDAVMTTGHGLDNHVLDRGTNYSVGQRQLVCLARAILRNNRILMLDEATANVDSHTDALIQRTIRTKFATCTVLTVAHRLNTIMDSDKVLVVDSGHIQEYDHPYVLLQNEYGPFTLLVKETGQAMHEQLYKVARDAYTAKHGDLQFGLIVTAAGNQTCSNLKKYAIMINVFLNFSMHERPKHHPPFDPYENVLQDVFRKETLAFYIILLLCSGECT